MSSTYNFGNLNTPKNTKSGLAEFALIAPLAWFAVVSTPKAPFAAKGDKITIKTAHTFVDTTKKFFKYRLAPQKNSGGYNPVGDRGLQSLNAQVTIFIAGSYAEALEAITELMNEPLMVLVRDSSCTDGQFYQIGDACAGAYITPTLTFGTTADGTKGWNIVIDADNGPLIYAPADATIASQTMADDDDADAAAGGGA